MSPKTSCSGVSSSSRRRFHKAKIAYETVSLELHQIRPNTRRGSPRNDDSAVSTPLNLGAQITAQQLAALPSRSFPEAGLLPDPPWPASRVSILVSAPTPAAGAFPPPPSSILAAFSRSAAVPARLPGRGGVLVGGPPRAATAHGAAVSGQARRIAPQRPRWGGARGGFAVSWWSWW